VSDLKTRPTRKSVAKYLRAVEHPQRVADALALLELMQEVTGEKAVLWGDSIVGFGSYHYKYKSGREGDWPVTGFAPRKQNLVVYIMPGFKQYTALLKKLGKHRHSSSCLYINKLEDISLPVLKQLVARAVKDMGKMYGRGEVGA
jgi:hypothetical protein